MTRLKSIFSALILSAAICMINGCGGGGSSNVSTQSVSGVAMPSNVSVVTAQNAGN